MLLFQIKELLDNKGLSSIEDIARHIGQDVIITRQMLDYWIKQNKVVKFLPENACCSTGKGCGSCTLLALEFYDVARPKKID